MSNKKNVPINYFSRDFNSIKRSLVEHTKRYYPDSYKDFNELGFGSLMLDTVSYIGDVLSFYLDYQVNESFLETATERKNILKLAKQMGYKFNNTPTSYGVASFFITVPSLPNGTGPDLSYIPKLKRRSEFTAATGGRFTLINDVDFGNPANEIVVAANDEASNLPTYWAIKAYGVVVSGYYDTFYVDVGSFKKFLKIRLPETNITEIVKIEDDEGKEYFQVENLSQDVIYVPIANRNAKSVTEPSSLLRPYSTPRRFTVEKDELYTYVQFGSGISERDSNSQQMAEPTEVVLQKHAKNYVYDTSFDPNKLINTEKLGIVPTDTTLAITARVNDVNSVNVAIDGLNGVSDPIIEFENEGSLDLGLLNEVKNSLEVTNDERILGEVPSNSAEEIKIRARNFLSTQNRAVTIQDYKSLVYNMPKEYGSVKRVNVLRDQNSFKRNLNLYVLSEDENGFLCQTPLILKENLKIWLNNNRMINDTIDILDAKIINLGINYTIINDLRYQSGEVLNECNTKLQEHFAYTREIGEPFFITDIQKVLKNTKGVLDVVDIEIVNKTGSPYSEIALNLDSIRSADGRYLNIPDNVIFEIKYPDIDIKGAIE